jgi:hypothetical protein
MAKFYHLLGVRVKNEYGSIVSILHTDAHDKKIISTLMMLSDIVVEMADTEIFAIDWSTLEFASNGLIKKRVSPDGRSFHEIRNTSGYQYIVDVSLFGNLIFKIPGQNGVLYNISY